MTPAEQAHRDLMLRLTVERQMGMPRWQVDNHQPAARADIDELVRAVAGNDQPRHLRRVA